MGNKNLKDTIELWVPDSEQVKTKWHITFTQCLFIVRSFITQQPQRFCAAPVPDRSSPSLDEDVSLCLDTG